MLVVLSPSSGNDNKDFTATFSSPLELTPHSKISLISAYLPLNFAKIYDTDPLSANFTGNVFAINSQLITTQPNPPNASYQQIFTVPANKYNLIELLNAMNEIIVNVGFPVSAGFSPHNTCYFSFDTETNCVVFNVVQDGNAQAIDYLITLEDNGGLLPDNLLQNLGFASGLTFNGKISILGSGSSSFASPPLSLSRFLGKSINIAFPSLNIQTLFSTGNLRNNNNVIHSIPFDISKVPYNVASTALEDVLGVVFYAYEPTHKEESEINNDGMIILNSLRVQLLDNDGNLSDLIDSEGLDEKVTIVVNIETEKEKQNEILRKVKDDKLYEKYSRNFSNYNP